MSDLVHLRDGNKGTFTAACGWKARTDEEQRDWVYNASGRAAAMSVNASSDVADVTCHACLEAAMRAGGAAEARFVQLEKDAELDSTGGSCAHAEANECRWCEALHCTACSVLVRRVDHIVYGATFMCPTCEVLENQIEEHPWPPRNRGGQQVGVSSGMLATHAPTGLAAFAWEERSQWANRKKARERLRAVLARDPRLWELVAKPMVAVRAAGEDGVAARMRMLEASGTTWRAVLLDGDVGIPYCWCAESHEGPCAP